MHISTFAKSDSDQGPGLTQSSADAKMKHQSEATKRTKLRQKPFKDEGEYWFRELLAVRTTKGRKEIQIDSLAKNRNSTSPFSKHPKTTNVTLKCRLWTHFIPVFVAIL